MTVTPGIEILLSIICMLLSAIGWYMAKLSSKVDQLIESAAKHEAEYISRFADRKENSSEHDQLYTRLNKHERELAEIHGFVRNLDDDRH